MATFSNSIRLLSLLSLTVVFSACNLGGPTDPTSPADPAGSGATAPTNIVNYTAIGASDTIGFGGSTPCVPFAPCPTGTGYVQVLTSWLREDGKTVTLLNLGLPGGVLGPEIQAIGNQLGRDIRVNFLENEMPFIATDSTLVTVFAGGNDVNTVGAAIEAGLGGADPAGYLRARTENFGQDLRTLVAGIKGRAPSARVVVLNLPNLAALPYAESYTSGQRRTLQEIAVAFSAQVNALTSAGAIVIDVMCDPSFYEAGMYSGDGFHPNDTGYRRMAEVIYPAASIGQSSFPRSSCPQMTIF